MYWVGRRSVVSNLFGKYSYAFYLFHQQITFEYIPFWLSIFPDYSKCTGLSASNLDATGGLAFPADCVQRPPPFFVFNSGVFGQLLCLSISIWAARLIQHNYQDRFVMRTYMAAQQKWITARANWLAQYESPENPLHFPDFGHRGNGDGAGGGGKKGMVPTPASAANDASV